MESIYQPLEFLIYTTIILLVIIGGFLIKFLVDLSALANSLQDFTKVMQAELEPAIREIKETLVNINNISTNVENQINTLQKGVKKGAEAFAETATVVGKHARSFGKVAFNTVGKNIFSGLLYLISRKK